MTEDPLVTPTSPGAALERLSYVAGALDRLPELKDQLVGNEPLAAQLTARRDALLAALTAGDPAGVREAVQTAQTALQRTYEALCRPGTLPPDTAAATFAALRLPDPLEEGIGKVDTSTVIVTYFKPVRQVITTISFADAAGATGYRLREVRYLNGEELEDDTVASYQPVFRRVRLPIGTHHFRIESHNPSVIAISDLFSFDVPQL